MNQRQPINRLFPILALLGVYLFGTPLALGQSKLTTADSFFAAKANFQNLLSDPRMQLLPIEVAEAAGKEYLGVNVRELVAVTMMARETDGTRRPPEAIVVLRFNKPQTLSGKLIEQLTKQEKTSAGTLYDSGNPWEPSVLQVSPTLFAVGMKPALESFQNTPVKNNIGKMLVKNSLGTDLSIYLDQQQAKFMWDDLKRFVDENYRLPREFDDLFELTTLVQSFEAGIDHKNKYEFTVVANCASAEDAQKAQQILVTALEYFQERHLLSLKERVEKEERRRNSRASVIAGLEGEPETAPAKDPNEVTYISTNQASLQYFTRIRKKFKTELTPKIEGNRLVLKLNHRHKYIGIPFSIMTDGSSPNLGIKRKLNPKNAIRQILLGMLNYEAAHGQFPSIVLPMDNRRKKGSPDLYSARVQLAPFLEHMNAVHQWDRDKAWNSPENAEITKQTISTFGETNKTRFRFPVLYLEDDQVKDRHSASSLMPSSGITFGDFTDGLSNSILIIEAPEDKAIEWTNPELWVLDNKNLIKSVFGKRNNVVVGLGDGSVHVIQRKKITEEALRALLTRSGGEVVDINEFK